MTMITRTVAPVESVNCRKEPCVLTERFIRALEYAAIVHAAQVRKGTSIPYVSHLLAVASLVLENGGDEDAAIAALLHDAPEDQGGEARLRDLAARFGERVAEIVRECSDSLSPDAGDKGPWQERKREYLERLRRSSDGDYLLVSCADKLHNARAILQDYRRVGDGIWRRFTEKGGKTANEIVGYYDACAEAFEMTLGGALTRELRLTVKLLKDASGKAPDRRWENRG